MRAGNIAFVLAAVCLMCLAALGKSQAASGSIEGTVTDMAGAVVPEVMVKARNLQTGLSREVATNSDGLYRLSLLPVGSYEVTFNKQGFTSVNRTGVKVQIG